MSSSKVSALTKEDIASAARRFAFNHKAAKWTVLVEGREFPVRPLVLEAAGVPPNDPTNSHQAVKLLRDRGFVVRYEGKALPTEDSDNALTPKGDDLIRSLRGSCKGGSSMVEARELEHRDERY